eukprot:TRINITY_DN6557_c0_g4_i1.p1 TRINITY_DN6557_c0_g4~~TRINITY_DN6557_c0_g4_i1.p1  ORF type:complete len:233 (+),score=38.74 TRINITY_DN6557_c0_g4_i1:94-699(+)
MAAGGGLPSSYMIQNLPSRWTTDALSKIIDAAGFEGMYDFLYAPRRTASEKSQNFGYAFINITSPTNAQSFRTAAETGALRFGTRIFRAVPASIQGIDALRSYFAGKEVMNQATKPKFVDAVMKSPQAVLSHDEGTALRSPPRSSSAVDESKTRRSSLSWCDMEDAADDDFSNGDGLLLREPWCMVRLLQVAPDIIHQCAL